jgi:hypothetical protein
MPIILDQSLIEVKWKAFSIGRILRIVWHDIPSDPISDLENTLCRDQFPNGPFGGTDPAQKNTMPVHPFSRFSPPHNWNTPSRNVN